MDIRLLTLDDHVPAFRLGAEAFGAPPYPAKPPEAPAELPAGREVWGAFDGDELVARVAAHEYASWWHGASIATCGVAGVTVAPERRGEGLLHPLFEAALGAAADRGEVISTLYPTANGIYRSYGYEVVSSYDTVELSLDELARVRPPTATRTRRATAADIPAVKALYDRWAALQNGPLTRTGPRFATTDEELVEQVTGVSLAVDADDRAVGYAIWDRGEGYDPAAASSALHVHDLVATTLDGYRALWLLFASYSSVVGRLRLSSSGEDAARLVLPSSTWNVVRRHPYMLKVSEPDRALTAAGLGLEGLAPTEVDFAVVGDRLGRADGTYRLSLGDGAGTCERVRLDGDLPTFTTQGLALAFAGVQSCANLRLTDHLAGPTTHDAVLDALLGTRPVHVRDYF